MARRKLITRSLGVFELLVGVGAVLGGGALAATPSGALLGMPLDLLDGTPFHNYLIPGLVLCLVVGGSNVVGGWLALREYRSAAISAVVGGLILIGWITSQIVLIGYRHPIQLVYLLCGALILLVGVALPVFDRAV
jgi:hypothetical protein